MSGLFAAQEMVIEPSFAAWRETARTLLESGTRPDEVKIRDQRNAGSGLLFSGETPEASADAAGGPRTVRVSREFVDRAQVVACHRSAERWDLLYRVLWRQQSERSLLRIEIDEDVAEFRKLEHQVKRDLHKMHAFVRFRKVEDEGGEHYVAWYEPDHFILEMAGPFFAERFAVMRWSILTPDASAHWDPERNALTYGPGVRKELAPQGDAFEAMWRTYYGSIFNPARMNLTAMKAEMPVRYWKNLPEIDSLPQMMEQAGQRVQGMIARQTKISAAAFVPEERSLPVLAEAVRGCEGCEIFRCATQAVFGRGPLHARLMLVGEQPGDEEDRRGEPFVGPAGRLLDELLVEAGIDRGQVYVTNAVKHFKFTERGKRRLHESPKLSEIFACRPWLEAELETVRPQVVVALGASAAKSMVSANFALMRERGKVVRSAYAERVVATIHPSAILRAMDPERAAEMRGMVVSDLRLAAEECSRAG